MINSWFLIANPTAGNGNFSKVWKQIKQSLKTHSIEFNFTFTKHSKHEIELVQNAIQKGFRNIITVGGDGTLHNVVNGIMTQRYVNSSKVLVAVIPIGTGNDWIKTYNIPKNINKAVELIYKKQTILQDIGYLKLNNKIVYFNNLAGIGYDGYVVNKTNKLKRFGSISYLLGGIAGLFFYKRTTLKIEINKKIIETNCLMTLFGICKFSGGGMQLTDYINKKNGFLNITIAKNLNLIDLLFNIKKLYNGTIIHHKKVEILQTKEIKITPLSINKPFIQADGELIGSGIVKILIIEKALQFIKS